MIEMIKIKYKKNDEEEFLSSVRARASNLLTRCVRYFLMLQRHIHNLDNIRLSKVIYCKLMQIRRQDDFDIFHDFCQSMNRLENRQQQQQ